MKTLYRIFLASVVGASAVLLLTMAMLLDKIFLLIGLILAMIDLFAAIEILFNEETDKQYEQ